MLLAKLGSEGMWGKHDSEGRRPGFQSCHFGQDFTLFSVIDISAIKMRKTNLL